MQARKIHLVRFYKVKATFPIGNVATIYIVLFMLVALFKSVVFFFLMLYEKIRYLEVFEYDFLAYDFLATVGD